MAKRISKSHPDIIWWTMWWCSFETGPAGRWWLEELATLKEEDRKPDKKKSFCKNPFIKIFVLYGAHWRLIMRVLHQVWELADGTWKITQTFLPKKSVLDEELQMKGGLDAVSTGWTRADVELWCRRCDACVASKGPQEDPGGISPVKHWSLTAINGLQTLFQRLLQEIAIILL